MNGKSFLVAMMFLLLFMALAGGILGGTDLTPDTPPAPNATNAGGVSLNRASVRGSSAGPCGNAYTIQAGDTLSGIATRCNLTVDGILSANPSIGNPNLIHAGQEIILPGANPSSAPQPEATAAPVNTPERSALETLPVAPTQPPSPSATLTSPPPTATATPIARAILLGKDRALKLSGARPNTPLLVEIHDLPPNAATLVQVGPVGGPYETVKELNADGSGVVKVEILLPADLQPGSEITVAVLVANDPPFAVTSMPFNVGP